ncbi:MAG TPA: TolC family protein, partial [Rubrivivax sp.]|nr:TolC family protein [Rubrivivax sp.]
MKPFRFPFGFRPSPLRLAGPLALVSLLAACSLTPEYERPEAPVAPAWVDAGSATGTPAADLDWTEFLTDERIRALVRLALQNNRDLRIAVLNVEQVRALYGVQRADRLPSLGVGATA